MILKELKGPPDLTRAQTLCIVELIEVIIVGKHQNFVFAAFQIVFPGLKRLKNY